MAWGGETYTGYVRVELFAGSGSAQSHMEELAIWGVGSGGTRYQGMMIPLPSRLCAAPGQWKAFVRTPEAIERNDSMPAILAVVAPDGSLRLYAYCGVDTDSPPVLRPIE